MSELDKFVEVRLNKGRRIIFLIVRAAIVINHSYYLARGVLAMAIR